MKEINYHNLYRNDAHNSEHEHYMHLEGRQQYTMLFIFHIKIHHYLEIKYLVSKMVTISLDV